MRKKDALKSIECQKNGIRERKCFSLLKGVGGRLIFKGSGRFRVYLFQLFNSSFLLFITTQRIIQTQLSEQQKVTKIAFSQ